jgi:excisionase family DNA binding protein
MAALEKGGTNNTIMNTNVNLLTPEKVAEILQINILTVYSYIKKGKLEAIRLGRSYRIVPEDLEHLIELNRVNHGKEIAQKNGR